jgi:hypothetical protein
MSVGVFLLFGGLSMAMSYIVAGQVSIQQSLDIEGVRCDDHDTEHAGSSAVSSLDNQVHFFLPLSALRKSPFGDLDS